MSLLNSTLVTFIVSSFNYFYTGNPELTVATKYGHLEGTLATSRAGNQYYEFLGVPFATPPVGDLRFEPPKPVEAWQGVKQATKSPCECIQFHIALRRQAGSEDCLYMNIFTRQIQSISNSTDKPLKLLPVLVYIHGGIFMTGGARIYGGRYFMDHDVVLVVLQYRLGAFGFLNTGDPDGIIRGNMGLKDQAIGLKWVQENIKQFGGDPASVTLVGQSAGAASAHLHLMSPMSRGLFSQVVTQSGTALAPWAFSTRPKEQAIRIAELAGCGKNVNSSMVEIVTCLKSIDASAIVEAHSDYPVKLYDRLVIFGPSVESINDTNTFLDDHPAVLLQTDRTLNIPWLNGVNSEEGLLFAAKMIMNETIQAELASNWSAWAPLFLNLQDHPEKEVLVKEIYEFYLGNLPTTTTNSSESKGPIHMDNLMNLTDMLSDRNFFEPIHILANWKQQQLNLMEENKGSGSVAPMYLYFYSYKGEFSLANFVLSLTNVLPQTLDAIVSTGLQWIKKNVLWKEPDHYGAGHADEMFMLFKVPILTQHEPGAKDYDMSRQMVDIWCTFAATGNPRDSPLLAANNGPLCWEPVGQFCPMNGNNGTINPSTTTTSPTSSASWRRFQYMQLDNVSEIVEEPFCERLQFWDSLGLIKY